MAARLSQHGTRTAGRDGARGVAVAVAGALLTFSCGFDPRPTSGSVACAPGGALCCPQGYVCVGRGAITAEGLPSGTGTCWIRRDIPAEVRNLVHDHTPSVSGDPACLVTDWLPPGLAWPDAGVSGEDGPAVVAGNDGSVDDLSTTPPTPTGGSFGDFPEGSASVATNWGINAAHDNAQPNDIVASPLTKKWAAHFDGKVLAPLVASGRVYVAAQEAQPNIRALDMETGALLWGPLALGGTVGLACDAVNVYTLDKNGILSAVDGASGSRSWTAKLAGYYGELPDQSSAYLFMSPPVAAGGMVYVNAVGVGGSILAIDAATGKIPWVYTTYGGGSGAIAVFKGVAFEAEACGMIRGFDARTGDPRWSVWLEACTGGGGTTPAIHQDRLWVRDSHTNYILDLDGKTYGSFLADLPPSFHRGNAYLVSKGVLTAMDATALTAKWTFSASSTDKTAQLYTSAVIAGAGGQVFVATADGWVHELKEQDGTLVSSDKAGNEVLRMVEGIGLPVGMVLAHNHLLVPAGRDLVAY